jgi:hypothetical protein
MFFIYNPVIEYIILMFVIYNFLNYKTVYVIKTDKN